MSKTKKVISVVLAAVLVMAMATVAIVSSSALEDGAFHVVAGAPELCGVAWDPAATENQMTYNADKDIYEKVFENVPVGEHQFKVTTGGAWDNGDFNLEGDAMFGGANAVASVTVDGSTVIVGFDGTKALLEIVAPAVEDTTAAEVETTAAEVETTVAEVETTVAEVETTVAEVETTVAEPVETTVAEVETTVAEPVETTVAEVETTAAEVETTVAEPVETTVAEPEETTAAAEADGIVVGGEEYTANVGDVVTYTFTLKTPKAIENIQATTKYDAAKLKLVDTTVAERFPNMTGVVANAADGAVYFNASEISAGFDFTAGATLVTLQFEVLDASYSEIATTIEEMVEFFGIDYITGGEIVADGVEVAETLTVPEVEDSTPVATTEATVVTTEATVTTTEAPATTKAPVADVTGTTGETGNDKDVPPTGSSVAIYAVLATLAMAAAAVVVLRKKVNG